MSTFLPQLQHSLHYIKGLKQCMSNPEQSDSFHIIIDLEEKVSFRHMCY